MKEIDIRTFTQVSLLLASLATSVNWSGETHRESWAAPGSPIEMNYIATIPSPARLLLSTPLGFDLDHDGQREFVLRVWEFSSIPGASGLLELYESTADDTFALVHVLDLADHSNDHFYPEDAGDIDDDGLADLVVRTKDFVGSGMSDFGYRVFESTDESTYPTELVWEAIQLGVGVTGGRIIDGDLDGKREITARVGLEVLTYENLGDNAYAATLVGGIPPDTFQSFEVLDDIDDDGRPEILQGSLGNIFAFESIGDDAYEPIWTWEDISNVSFMVNAGDLDGDGRKEFLAGGWDGSVGASVLYIFESVGNNQVDVVATLLQNNGAEAYTSAEVADVDGDGRFEIVFATTWVVSIHENVGNDSWEQIWSANWGADAAGPMQYVAAGDHDGDGKAEIIFNQGGYTESFTGVWEIDPAYAADPDHDGRVTVIDNCPSQYNPDQADADGDAVGDVCDNCVHGPNPAQGFAPLGQAIVATDTDTFSWVLAADVVYVRGDLAAVASYGVDTMQTLPLATSLTDASIPGSGSGFYYLLRPDCSVGSWQTEIGAEPGRDVTLP